MSTLKTVFILSMILILSSGWSQQINSDSVIGIWLTSKGECKIQIYEREGKYYGKVVWLNEPNDDQGNPVRDTQNPDPKLRNKPNLGSEILKDFSYAGNGKWTNGTIYNPENGKTYHAQMRMTEMKVISLKGYIGIPALGLTTNWTRCK